MKIVVRLVIAVVLLSAGFAAGLPVGQGMGFTSGSEWALVQANVLAREAGLFMPVYMEEGSFRVVMPQPRSLHRRARQLAELYPGNVENVGQTAQPLLVTADVAHRH